MIPARIGDNRNASPFTQSSSIHPYKMIRSSSYQSINKSFEIESLSGRILEATRIALDTVRSNQEKKSRGMDERKDFRDSTGVLGELRETEYGSFINSQARVVKIPRSQKRTSTGFDENYSTDRASLTNESHDKQIPKPSSIRFRSPFKSG